MVWSMGWTISTKTPPGLPNAMPKGRSPVLKMRVTSADTSVLVVGESLKKSRPVYHCWLICPSQSDAPLPESQPFDGSLQDQGGALLYLAKGGRVAPSMW